MKITDPLRREGTLRSFETTKKYIENRRQEDVVVLRSAGRPLVRDGSTRLSNNKLRQNDEDEEESGGGCFVVCGEDREEQEEDEEIEEEEEKEIVVRRKEKQEKGEKEELEDTKKKTWVRARRGRTRYKTV